MARMDVIGKTGPFTLARGGGQQVSNVRNLIARATSSSLDNLGSHKGAAVRDIVKAAGARLFFLPPYSPDLNPIEQLFAKLKHFMRRAARRSVEAVHNAIAATLSEITPKECQNYIENAGYKST